MTGLGRAVFGVPVCHRIGSKRPGPGDTAHPSGAALFSVHGVSCKNVNVTDMRTAVACVQCQVHWYLDLEPAKCTDHDHDHRRFELHQHRSVVILPDGTEVTAASFDAVDPYARDHPPDYGLYLDQRWQPPWTHDHLDWPDFGVPDGASQVADALKFLLDRAHAGDQVEVGCLGGHGRTGTALACLAILSGHPPGESVSWVRANYCSDAVETVEQEAFIIRFLG